MRRLPPGRVAWGGLRPTRSAPCSALRLSLEDPVDTAILLSLVGVKSILANQWPTVLQDNALRASVLWESEWAAAPARPAPQTSAGARTGAPLSGAVSSGLLAAGKPTGRAVRLLQKMQAGDVVSHGTWTLPPAPRPPGPVVP